MFALKRSCYAGIKRYRSEPAWASTGTGVIRSAGPASGEEDGATKPKTLIPGLIVGLVLLSWGVWGLDIFALAPPADAWPVRNVVVERLSSFPSEARLTGGFRYAPPASLSPALPDADMKRLSRVAEAGRSPRSQADSALLWWISGDLHRALEKLESAVRYGDDDGYVWTDLSAAHLTRAYEERQAFALVEALEAADRAVAVAPQLPEARFNRALAFEKLYLPTEATKAWADFLNLGEGTPWDLEARERVDRLRAAAAADWEAARSALEAAALAGDAAGVARRVRELPQESREHAEAALAEWAGLQARDPEKARRRLAVARAIGAALLAFNREGITADAAAAIDGALSAVDPRRLEDLVQGHLRQAEGRRLYDAYQIAGAKAAFADAAARLRRARSPFAGWAAFFLAACDYHQGAQGRALAALERLQRAVPGDRYASLAGRSEWVRGLIHSGRFEPLVTLQLFSRALGRFEALREAGHAAALNQFVAETLFLLGEDERAWDHLYAALGSAGRLRDPRRAQSIFGGAAQVVARQGRPALGIYFENEAIRVARGARNPTQVVVGLLARARMRADAGQTQEALADLAKARELAAETRDEVQAGLLADADFIEGDLLKIDDPAAAVERLSNALASREAAGNYLDHARLYLARAIAHLELGRDEAAEADLRAGIREVGRGRANVLEQARRPAHLERVEGLFDLLIGIQAGRDQKEEAFRIAESSRARVSLDLLPGSRVASVEDVQAALPENAVLLEYAVLDDRLLLWVVDRQRADLMPIPRPPGAGALAETVDAFLAAMASGREPEALRLSGVLYRWLIAPVEERIPPGGTVILVPDKALHQLPFVALRSPDSERFLVERAAVAVAPSATLYVQGVRNDCQLGLAAPETALVIGNPAFDSRLMPGLEDLDEAAKEAETVAGMLPGAVLLRDEKATPAAFLDLAPRSAVVHLATHAIPNPSVPLLSRLVLAADPGRNDPGVLYSRDLYGLDLHRTRLVFLSGCGTAAGPVIAGEGMSGLTRPFLAAGVPAVVGSLRAVRDDFARGFATAFYTSLNAGEDPLRAFHAAQLESFRARDGSASPWDWALFQFAGGTCSQPRR